MKLTIRIKIPNKQGRRTWQKFEFDNIDTNKVIELKDGVDKYGRGGKDFLIIKFDQETITDAKS